MKKYIGTFSYGATGEGYRVYSCYFTTNNNNADPKWVFYNKLLKKWPGAESLSFDLLKSGWEYFSNGISLYDPQDNTWYKQASDDIHGELTPGFFERLTFVINKNGVCDGDFEFFNQYNLS